MPSADLKPCPFCGAAGDMVELTEVESVRVGIAYVVECLDCGAMTWPVITADRAVRAWNSRAEEKNIAPES